MKKIVFCGPKAPPVGGVSVHIDRLSGLLSARGWSVDYVDESKRRKDGVFNIRSLDFVGYIKKIRAARIIHIHSSVWVFRLINVLVGLLLGKRVIVTLHSWRGKRTWSWGFWRLLLARVHQVIAVNPTILDVLNLKGGIVAPAFLPPAMDLEPTIPHSVEQLVVAAKAERMPVLVSSAYRIEKFQGADLYGIDVCLDACGILRESLGRAFCFIFVVANVDSETRALFDFYRAEIARRGLSGCFFLLDCSLSFSSLLAMADVCIRATNTDGDAVSVREALYLNRPVIASAVVARPQGTVLFKSRDPNDLAESICLVLEGRGDVRRVENVCGAIVAPPALGAGGFLAIFDR